MLLAYCLAIRATLSYGPESLGVRYYLVNELLPVRCGANVLAIMRHQVVITAVWSLPERTLMRYPLRLVMTFFNVLSITVIDRLDRSCLEGWEVAL